MYFVHNYSKIIHFKNFIIVNYLSINHIFSKMLLLIVLLIFISINNAFQFRKFKLKPIQSQLLAIHKSTIYIPSMALENVEYNIPKPTITSALNTFYKFSRPHTIKGTILASFMGVTRALIENPNAVSLKLIPRAVIGLIALLCGNAYIVGINQIYDVKIDEVRSLSTFTSWINLII